MRILTNQQTGYRATPDAARQVITYTADVDPVKIAAIARRAVRNKDHTSHDGPLTVTVTAISEAAE
jgi:hypothetical protein